MINTKHAHAHTQRQTKNAKRIILIFVVGWPAVFQELPWSILLVSAGSQQAMTSAPALGPPTSAKQAGRQGHSTTTSSS
jgi:hypothetical protein